LFWNLENYEAQVYFFINILFFAGTIHICICYCCLSVKNHYYIELNYIDVLVV